jgi:hypothetical protein
MRLLDGSTLPDAEVINDIECNHASIFNSQNFVVVRNILCEKAAEDIYHFLNVTMGEARWWYRAANYVGSPEYYLDNGQSQEALDNAIKLVNDASGKEGFFYTFRRTLDNHYKECQCMCCSFNEFLKGKPLLDFISKIIGEEVTTPVEVFSNYYGKGDFLGPHHDGMKGKVGFVLYLTKNWKPQYGGNLHFLTEDWLSIREVFVPGFNTLLLFKLPEDGKGIPHFVSRVETGEEKRLAISGWFK